MDVGNKKDQRPSCLTWTRIKPAFSALQTWLWAPVRPYNLSITIKYLS